MSATSDRNAEKAKARHARRERLNRERDERIQKRAQRTAPPKKPDFTAEERARRKVHTEIDRLTRR